MNRSRRAFVSVLGAVGLIVMSAPALADGIDTYLVIGTGQGTAGDEFVSFDMSNVEIGADQEIVSNSSVGGPSQRVGSYTGGLDLTGTWVPNDGALRSFGGNRWDDLDPDHGADTVGVPDRQPFARPIFEGIDFSGNVAITGDRATFQSSNSDVNADIGIRCNRTAASCFPEPSSSNSFFDAADPNNNQDLNALNGVSTFDPTSLNSQLEAFRDFVVGLTADVTWTSTGFNNINIKDSGAPEITDLDAIDLAGDANGIAVIDIDIGDNAFQVNNTDWILETAKDTLVIFRMADGTQFDFSNSSITMGDGDDASEDIISSLGAIFFMDAFRGTNELFNLNNVILGGIGLYDFTDFNPGDTLLAALDSSFDPAIGDNTVINLQDAQGCAQFIGHQVLMSNNRWTRCSRGPMDVTEPSIVLLLGLGLGGIGFARLRRRH